MLRVVYSMSLVTCSVWNALSVSGSGCSAAQFAELDNKPSLANSHYIRSLDYGISFEDPQLNQVGVYLFWSLCLSLSHTLLIVTQMTGTGTNSCVYPLPCPLRLFETLKQQTCLALLFHIHNLAGSVTVVVVSPHLSFSTSEPAYLFCNCLIIICLFSPWASLPGYVWTIEFCCMLWLAGAPRHFNQVWPTELKGCGLESSFLEQLHVTRSHQFLTFTPQPTLLLLQQAGYLHML